jgi:DNA-directed RNA polymerase subunit RPC12/RpoP
MTQEALKLALEWAETHGEIVFAGGGMDAVNKMNSWVTAIKEAIREHAMYEVQRLGQDIEQEPVCPDCKAKVLYECVACSSNNYPPQRTEQNFCQRCGKRTNDIHTCTPPQRSESSGKPSAWVGLTNEELTDLFYNTNLGQQSAVSQAVALLKEKNE